MMEIIAAVIGIFSGSASERENEHLYIMGTSEVAISKNEMIANAAKAAEILIPIAVIVLIVFLIKKYK